MSTDDPYDFPPISIESPAPSFDGPSGQTSRLLDAELEKMNAKIRERARREAKRECDAEDGIEAAAAKLDLSAARTGGQFLFGDAPEIEVIWGTAERCAWSGGEGLMIFGPQGTGKSTLAQQLMKGRLGLLTEVLGMPVTPDTRKVLYIAGDRPRQIRRAMRRLFRNTTAEERQIIDERLVVWEGPLPFNLTQRPQGLQEMAQQLGCGTIFVDSVKDVVPKLSDDEAGNMWNQTVQFCMRENIQLCALHHPRKANAENASKPKSIDDIYGSVWLTAGLGSIISLWGKTGDLVVDFTQLKLVNDEVGPFQIEHDHDAGLSSVVGKFDLIGSLIKAGELTAAAAAALKFDTDAPSKNEVSQVRRSLKGLVKLGMAVEHAGVSGGVGGGTAARWTPTENAAASGGRTSRHGASPKGQGFRGQVAGSIVRPSAFL